MTSPPSGPAPFALRTLGSAALLGADGGVVLGPGKPLALLAYLALEPRRSATRDHLLDLLWGDLDPEKARHALRQTLWYLKQVLGPDALAATRGEVTLALPLATDVERFLAAVGAGELEPATMLYTGSFLGEFAVPGGVEFEHWADIERQRNRAAFLSAADALVRRQLATGRHREAQQLARRARDEARGNEAAWRLLLEAHAQAGDHLGFSMEASSLAVLCAAEGREPEPATRALLRRLERQEQVADPAGAARTLTAELVGREREFAVLVQAWQELGQGGRHVHVTAPAGLGKTRLLHDLHERLRSLGARVLLLRANPGEGSIGYAFLGRLATELATLPGAAAVSPASAGTLVALSPLLSSRYAATPDAAAGEEALRRRAAALAELLAVVSDERPVAVLLDDAHWLDAASRSALRSVLERLADTRALVITASRLSGPASMAADGALVLPLHPLSAAQVLALVGSLGSVPAAPWGQQLPAALARATGGSPLLILETLQLALEAGWLGLGDGAWSCPDPAGLARRLGEGSAIRHRVTQLEHPARLTLLALALAGTPLPAHLVAPATGLAPEAAEAALAALEQRGLVTRAGDHFQPAHDEIAAASQDLADAGSVADLHAGLGRTLAGARRAELTDLARAGRHLHLASRHAELVGVFSRYLRRLRAQGDGRRVVAVAYEFLGEGTPHDEVAALVRRLPLVTRVLRSSVRGAVTAGMLALLLAVLAFVVFRPEPATLAVVAVEVDPAGRWHYAGTDLTARTWATTGSRSRSSLWTSPTSRPGSCRSLMERRNPSSRRRISGAWPSR
ncbi:MAG: AAA family ATPase [Gemmatimonadetes bacterium]|nr:AAA family ATPase [Gemmatimonadota bacterium]